MYSYKTKIGYSQCGTNGRALITALVNLMQDCSTFQSDALGIGIKELSQANRAWLLSSWQIVIEDLPKEGEKIEVSTLAYAFKGCYGNRNFAIKDKTGKLISYANSIWFYYDTKERKPVRYTPLGNVEYPLDPPLDMALAPRKIAYPAEENGKLYEEDSIKILRSSLDTNNHVNNCEYIKFALDHFPEELEECLSFVKQIRVEYKNAAHLGDILFPEYLFVENEGKIFVRFLDEEGNIYAVLELADKICKEKEE